MATDPRHVRLASIEDEKSALREQMAARAELWKQAAVTWAQADWQQTVEREIQDQTGKVKELAASGQLSELKRRMEALKLDAPARVAEHFDNAALWSHIDGTIFETEGSPKRPDQYHYETYRVKSGPSAFDEPLRRLKGEVLALLDEVGLLDRDKWQSVRRSGDSYRYPYSLDWPEELMERMRAYSERYQAFLKLEVERQTIETELAQEEAGRLWEQA